MQRTATPSLAPLSSSPSRLVTLYHSSIHIHYTSAMSYSSADILRGVQAQKSQCS